MSTPYITILLTFNVVPVPNAVSIRALAQTDACYPLGIMSVILSTYKQFNNTKRCVFYVCTSPPFISV